MIMIIAAWRERVSRRVAASLCLDDDHSASTAQRSSTLPHTRTSQARTSACRAVQFEHFCDAIGVPPSDRYPISCDLLLAFVCSFAGKVRADTVRNHLSALSTWHAVWGVDWRRFAPVSQALKGLDKYSPPRDALRPPILADHLLAVKAHLDIQRDPLHAAVWACALFSWWCCCRLGETTVPSISTFNPSRHPSRASLLEPRHAPGRSFVLDVQLPWTKTTRESGLLKSVAAVGGELDPVLAMYGHLSLSPALSQDFPNTHLFAFRNKDGSALVPLDKETMIATFNAALLKAGRSAFTGHSFRIGGATAHWHAGASLSDIKLIGGWKSNVVVKYLRDYAAGLLPAHRRTAAAIAEVAARSAAPPATEA